MKSTIAVASLLTVFAMSPVLADEAHKAGSSAKTQSGNSKGERMHHQMMSEQGERMKQHADGKNEHGMMHKESKAGHAEKHKERKAEHRDKTKKAKHKEKEEAENHDDADADRHE